SILIAVMLSAIPGCASHQRRVAVERTAYLDDKVIAARVTQKLKQNPGYRFPRVEVHATNGVVFLTGMVENPAQKEKARDLARQVDATRQVDNRLHVPQESTEKR